MKKEVPFLYVFSNLPLYDYFIFIWHNEVHQGSAASRDP